LIQLPYLSRIHDPFKVSRLSRDIVDSGIMAETPLVNIGAPNPLHAIGGCGCPYKIK